MRLPSVAGTLSNSTMLSWTNLDQMVAQTIFQAVITDNFSDLSAWTKTDSGTNVNLSNGIVTMNGASSWTSNGIRLTTGITRAQGYFEFKASFASNLQYNILASINNTNALPNGTPSGSLVIVNTNTGGTTISSQSVGANMSSSPITTGTWYTFRLYCLQCADGTWRKFKATIQGGAYSTETTLSETERPGTSVDFASTIYFSIARYATNANLTSIKEFRWYSGYATSGPYIEYVHDAGSGKVFVNFDPTSLALPGTVPTTNLQYAWSFDDGSAGYSAWLTLAALNAVGKQTANHRYVRLRVQLNSDGPTYLIGAEPNSDTATDGIFNSWMITSPSATAEVSL